MWPSQVWTGWKLSQDSSLNCCYCDSNYVISEKFLCSFLYPWLLMTRWTGTEGKHFHRWFLHFGFEDSVKPCQETLYGAMYKFTILLRCLSQNCCCFCIIRTNWSCLSMDTSTSEERTRDSRSHYSKSLNASLHRQWLCIEMMNSLLIRTRLSVTVIQTFGL